MPEPVLYLHGFPNSGFLWRKTTAVVSSRYHTITPDLPGFGDAELTYSPQSWRGLIDWLDSFVDGLGLGPVHLGVHDWGGLVGLPWMCEHPEKVRSLLITNTSFSSTDRWHALATEWRKPDVGEEMMSGMTADGFAAMMSTMASKPLDAEAVAEYWKCLSTPERRQAQLEMYRSLEFSMFEPYMDEFPKIATGISRVVWGGDDPFVPAKIAHRFGERLGAEVTILEASHFVQEDAGEELGHLHLDFLASL
ncbi:MAG: alpha/beta hydrolase [Actinomycetota bacterium]